MPMRKSDSDDATEDNFHEFRHGPRFRSMARKYGMGKARKVMQAAVLRNKRRYRGHYRRRRRAGHTKAR